jgi:hypothetical protein
LFHLLSTQNIAPYHHREENIDPYHQREARHNIPEFNPDNGAFFYPDQVNQPEGYFTTSSKLYHI